MFVHDGAGMNDNSIYSDQSTRSRKRLNVRTFIVALLVAGGAGTFTWNQLQAKEQAKPVPVKLTVSEKPVSRETGVTSFAPVVKKVAPSVVKIVVTASTKNVAHQVPDELLENPMFRRFFGENGERSFDRRNMPTPKQH